MDKEKIKQILENPPKYDQPGEDSLRSWMRDAYSRQMLWPMVGVYIQYVFCTILAVLCAVKFFDAETTKSQIMYAALFICFIVWIGAISCFGWIMMQRPRISRLELRIADLIETIKEK